MSTFSFHLPPLSFPLYHLVNFFRAVILVAHWHRNSGLIRRDRKKNLYNGHLILAHISAGIALSSSLSLSHRIGNHYVISLAKSVLDCRDEYYTRKKERNVQGREDENKAGRRVEVIHIFPRFSVLHHINPSLLSVFFSLTHGLDVCCL